MNNMFFSPLAHCIVVLSMRHVVVEAESWQHVFRRLLGLTI